MIELSDKVKCDASSFEVEWRRLSPNGCEYRQVDTPDDENGGH